MKLNHGFSLALSVVAVAALGCKSTPASKSAEWTYTGSTGPAHWGDLSPEYALAKIGRAQSPIDVRDSQAPTGNLPPIAVAYPEAPLVILNNGHTVEVKYPAGGMLTVGQETYELQQFHFHSPSEHTFNGVHAPLEVHLVHKDKDGELAVIGVMVVEGAANAFLAEIWPHLPRTQGEPTTVAGMRIDVDELLPASKATYRYPGSLTTPPCSEGVAWFLLEDEVQASAEQVRAFRAVISGNNRPTQPLNGRIVLSNP